MVIEPKFQEPDDVNWYCRLLTAIHDRRLRYRVYRYMDGRFNRSFLSQPVTTTAYFPYYWMVRLYKWWHCYDDGRSYMNFVVMQRHRSS